MMAETPAGGMLPLLNIAMKFILGSPLHPVASSSMMLLRFTGRKSGKTYTTPVSYMRQGDTVTLFTHAKWWRNLSGGAPVRLRIQGQELIGEAYPCSDDKNLVATALQAYLECKPSEARFYQVGLDENGKPEPAQVERAALDTVLVKVRLEK